MKNQKTSLKEIQALKRKDIKMLSNKVYDILKWIAMYLLPALATLYFALSGIWGFPFGEEIVGTLTAIDTFLGIILGISSINYSQRGPNP